MIRISVVVPTYKRSHLLKRCLSALTHQYLQPEKYEIIVVSDGPCAASLECVKEIQQTGTASIRYFSLAEKGGPAAARNLGWQQAAGTIVAFTDDDCVPCADWLINIYETFENQGINVVYGRLKVPIGSRPTDFERQTAQLETPAFVTANAACTKKALEEAGGFDERYKVAWREDSDLEFAFRNCGYIPYYAPNCLVHHPVRKARWGVSIKEQKKSLYNALLKKKYPFYYRLYINGSIPLFYYTMTSGILLSLIYLVLGRRLPAVIFASIALVSLIYFIYKRLHNNSHKPAHVAEMVVTSLCIPFLSLYWNWYGTYKFRKIKSLQNRYEHRCIQGPKAGRSFMYRTGIQSVEKGFS